MKVKRIGRPRAPAITRIVANTFEGTQEIIEALVKESTGLPAWRPVRAAASRALSVRGADDHVWMTREEFGAWYKAVVKPGVPSPLRDVGIAPSRRKSIIEEGAPVKPAEAFAIAHYRLGLPLPCALEPAAFDSWLIANFGAAEAASRAIGMHPQTINDAARGFSNTSRHGRVARAPDVTMVRALDWLLRVGPFSPYGSRAYAPDFPGQKEEDPRW